eukprot:11808502-Heterocapsa_arctica.AAC.1
MDFAAAFPSILHCWLFAVLAAMGVPDYIRKAIELLYDDCRCFVVFGGATGVSFLARSGIKQGCPLSGVLFAIGLDPFLRMLGACLPRCSTRFCAFADDIAFAVQDIFATMPIIMQRFLLLERATGMKLNHSKCVLVVLWRIKYD